MNSKEETKTIELGTKVYGPGYKPGYKDGYESGFSKGKIAGLDRAEEIMFNKKERK